jgi:hypothetical protein
MKNFFSALFATFLVFFCLYCGKKGDILPPLVRFPQAIEEIRAVQKSDRIILTWINPTAYEDGSTLSSIEVVEIWALEEKTGIEESSAKILAEEFEKVAKPLAVIPQDRFEDYAVQDGTDKRLMAYAYDLSGDFLSKKYTFGLRVKDRKRYSAFSVLVSVKPMVLPLPPTEVKAEVFADRIEITWKPLSGSSDSSSAPNVKGYNVYRSMGEEGPQRRNSRLVEEEKYGDRDFVFGQTYRYFVRASATETSPYLESEDSEAIEIFAKDTFAPEPPQGLVSVSGQDVVAISWDPNEEEDLAGYRVWRREEGTEEIGLLTPEPIKESVYNDRAAEKGKMYAYAVTAVDISGNESRISNIIIDGIRERK